MKIARQEIVISFEIDPSIVLSCGTAIQNMQKKVGGQILSINAPDDAPPSMPRIMLRLKDTIFNLCLDRIQFTVVPPSQVTDEVEKSSKFTLQRISPLLTEILPSIPKYFWAGVITEVEYPESPLKSKSANDATTPIFDKLININRNNKALSTFQLQYGVNDDLNFTTYTISGFEGRKVELKPPQKPGFLILDPPEYPLTECGIRVLLDINNRPSKQNEYPLKDIEAILSKTNSLVANIAEDLNLQGVIT